jgi:hypothetical protein
MSKSISFLVSLQTAEGIQTIPLEVPADYPEVTDTAK